MAILKWHSAASGRILVTIIAALGLLVAPPISSAEWGGAISSSGSTTEVDTIRSRAADQQVIIHTNGRLAPRLNYLLSLRYRRLDSKTENTRAYWQTEFQPSATANWATPVYDFRGQYTYRANRDQLNTNEITGREASAFFQTNLSRLPRLRSRYEWSSNVNDLDLIGFDTRSRTASIGTSYIARAASLSYDYADRSTVNRRLSLDRNSREQIGRFDLTKSALKSKASAQLSYQINHREEQEHRGTTGETLIFVPAVSGLYRIDATPEFDELQFSPGLTDAVLTIPASEEMNLYDGRFHNFGLDFGASVEVDHLFLYHTDTLIVSNIAWSVWTSNDNLNWSRAQGSITAEFSAFFRRFEISFPVLESRYVKLTMDPVLNVTPVYATELRALVSRDAGAKPQEVTDQRGSTQIRLAPAKWMHIGGGVGAVRANASQTALAREERSYAGDIRIAAAKQFETVGQYRRDRTEYPESGSPGITSELMSLSLLSEWSKALLTRLAIDRRTELTDDLRSRRNDGARGRLQVTIFPGLRTITELGLNEDHRFTVSDVFTTRSFWQSVDCEPIPRSTVVIEYRHYDYDARVSSIPSFRQTTSARGTYQFTNSISLIGSATTSREPNRNDYQWDGTLSWNATRKLALSAGVNRIGGKVADHLTQYSLQAYFRWSAVTDINFGYSTISSLDRQDVTTARLGLNTRF